MSLETDGVRLLEAVQADPTDPEGWRALGRWCARAGTGPPGATSQSLGPALIRYWRRRADDRDLVPLLLGLLDAELVHPDPAPGVLWAFRGSLREAPDHTYHAGSGLPLVLRRRRDGARMRLLPWSYVELGREAGRTVKMAREPAGYAYMDEVPVGLEQLAAFRGLPATTGALPALVEGDEALAYAAAMGGVVPTEPEWGGLCTRAAVRRGAPTFQTPHLDGEERREMREAWRSKVAPLLEEACSLGVAFAPVPEWTASPADWFERRTEASLGGAGERLVVRGMNHLSASPRSGTLHAFRVAMPLGCGDTAPPPDPPRVVG